VTIVQSSLDQHTEAHCETVPQTSHHLRVPPLDAFLNESCIAGLVSRHHSIDEILPYPTCMYFGMMRAIKLDVQTTIVVEKPFWTLSYTVQNTTLPLPTTTTHPIIPSLPPQKHLNESKLNSISPHDYKTIWVLTPHAEVIVFIVCYCCSRSCRTVPAVVQSL